MKTKYIYIFNFILAMHRKDLGLRIVIDNLTGQSNS